MSIIPTLVGSFIMSHLATLIRLTIATATGVFLLNTSATADAISDFYKGKTIAMIVGYSPGGTDDVWARLMARHLGGHIPGSPNFVVQNMPGAGSITAANYIYRVAPQDGTVMGLMSTNNPFMPLLGLDQAEFDPLKFTWLGSPTVDTDVLMVWKTAPVNTFDDARKVEVILGGTSPNATSSFYARILNEVFKTKLKIIYGYPGMTETFVAMENGEVMGYPNAAWSFLKSSKPNWIRDKQVKFLLQFGGRRIPDLPQVPFAADMAMPNNERPLLIASMDMISLGYPFLMGPEVPADRAAAIRQAYSDTFKDPEFLADGAKLNLDIAPISGEQIQKVIADAYSVPQPVIEEMRALYNAPSNGK